jgi:hypothetical protein
MVSRARVGIVLEGKRNQAKREGLRTASVRNYGCEIESYTYLWTTFRVLVSLLKMSEDPLVLAVAAHDLGQYVKYADRGKK